MNYDRSYVETFTQRTKDITSMNNDLQGRVSGFHAILVKSAVLLQISLSFVVCST